jgi:hypothetical protein
VYSPGSGELSVHRRTDGTWQGTLRLTTNLPDLDE